MPRASEALLICGKRLRAAREALGIEAKEAARSAGAGASTWSMWENGHRLADPLAVARFCARYGISMDWVYMGDTRGMSPELAKLVVAQFPIDPLPQRKKR